MGAQSHYSLSEFSHPERIGWATNIRSSGLASQRLGVITEVSLGSGRRIFFERSGERVLTRRWGNSKLFIL